MGSGSWSSSTYRTLYSSSYTTKDREEIFTQRTLHADLDLRKSKAHIRESRDSEEHPESVPFFIALDETGSMGSVPDKLIRNELPKLMDSIIDALSIKHPQILFMGVGDHECDSCPCQVGQFESSTTAINQNLSKIYLEGRGGGNNGESYLLAWIIAGNHTSIDSLEKRGKKGYLFTIGDEPTLERISADTLSRLTGQSYEKGYTWQEAFECASKKYEVFHIHIVHGSDWHGVEVKRQLQEVLGDRLIFCKPDELVETICNATAKVSRVETHTATQVSVEETEVETKTDNFTRSRRR